MSELSAQKKSGPTKRGHSDRAVKVCDASREGRGEKRPKTGANVYDSITYFKRYLALARVSGESGNLRLRGLLIPLDDVEAELRFNDRTHSVNLESESSVAKRLHHLLGRKYAKTPHPFLAGGVL